jgi:hypothetical protein
MPSDSPDVLLTLQAKEAIRNYLLRLVAFPGIVISLVMFLLGYLINDVARKDAYNNAYANVSERILTLAMSASKAAEDAKRSSDQTDAARKAAVATQFEATKISDNLKTAWSTVQATANADQLATKVALTLSSNESFKQSVRLSLSGGAFTKVGYGSGVHEWKQKAAQCGPNSIVIGIEVEYGGTCRSQCDADGAVIREIRLLCKAV